MDHCAANNFRSAGVIVGSVLLLLGIAVTSGSFFSALGAERFRAASSKTADGDRLAASGTGERPLAFEANMGQTNPLVRFVARGEDYSLFLTGHEAVFALGGEDRSVEVVRIGLLEANPSPIVKGLSQLPGKTNYFIGDDPKKWIADVPSFAGIRAEEVYPGIDLVYHSRLGQLEYDFVVSPGADAGVIQLQVSGAESLSVDEAGDLILKTTSGELRQHRPVIYQETEGDRRYIAGEYVVRSERRVGFQLAEYDPDLALVIDPVLVYSTYVGGSGFEQTRSLAVDPEGNTYLVGETDSINFPAATPTTPPLAGGRDGFVTKLDPTGNKVVYTTFLGGNGDDEAFDIELDDSNNAYIVGGTQSSNFPTMNAVQGAYGGGSFDAFVTKLDTAGGLVYSTFVGGSGFDFGGSIEVDNSGSVVVVGDTDSRDFPTKNPLQQTYAGGASDTFLTKLNADGTEQVYSSYLGGSGEDLGNSVDLGIQENVYIAGFTGSMDFPTTAGAFQQSAQDAANGYITKLDRSGASMTYSTYLGGTDFDSAVSIDVDAEGSVHVLGNTFSNDFPPATTLQTVNGGEQDLFVAQLNAEGSALGYSTYLGGEEREASTELLLDPSGNIFVIGLTESSNFPTANPLQSRHAGDRDAVITKLAADGSALLFSTYLGGAEEDLATGLGLDASGNVYVAGTTDSADFPIAGTLQPVLGGGADAFVAKIGETGPRFTAAGLVNSGSFDSGPIAPDSWVDLFGENLATQFLLDSSFPTSLDGTSIAITDSQGSVHAARLHFVNENRIQFLAPSGMASGPATMRVTSAAGSNSARIQIAAVAPGFFSANASGQGPAAAVFTLVREDGTRVDDLTFTLDPPPNRANVPLILGGPGAQLFVSLFGTGFRSQSSVGCRIGDVEVPVVDAVDQGQFAGLDQAVVGPVPRTLAGKTDVGVECDFDGIRANIVTLSFQ